MINPESSKHGRTGVLRRVALAIAASVLALGISLVGAATASAAESTPPPGGEVVSPTAVDPCSWYPHPVSVKYNGNMVGSNVNIRWGPYTSCPSNFQTGAVGMSVGVYCYAYGTSVNGDSVWHYTRTYHSGQLINGWIAGYWINTGSDPRPGVPAC